MKIIILILIVLNLHADTKQKMLSLYKSKNYKDACNIGFTKFNDYRSDEEYVTLYAFSCLNSDFLDRLSIPIAILKYTKESRANSAYFSIILMQKKILYHSLLDGYDLTSVNMPTTDYVLSKVFDLYAKLDNREKKDFYIFEDEKDSNLTYKLYLLEDNRLTKIVIEEYYHGKMIKHHVYW